MQRPGADEPSLAVNWGPVQPPSRHRNYLKYNYLFCSVKFRGPVDGISNKGVTVLKSHVVFRHTDGKIAWVMQLPAGNIAEKSFNADKAGALVSAEQRMQERLSALLQMVRGTQRNLEKILQGNVPDSQLATELANVEADLRGFPKSHRAH